MSFTSTGLAIAALAICSLTTGCASAPRTQAEVPEPELARVTGTVTYRERVALPPEAVIEVRLEDVSRADAAATTLGAQHIVLGERQVPVPFVIDYDPQQIEERGRYVMRAEVLVGGEKTFATTESLPVLTQGHPSHVDVLLERIRSAPARIRHELCNTRWRLRALGTDTRIVTDAREPYLVLQQGQGKFFGSGGVNLLIGSYQIDGAALTLTPGPATLMAGGEAAMEQERAFVAALVGVQSYVLDGEELTLTGDGEDLLVFEAAARDTPLAAE